MLPKSFFLIGSIFIIIFLAVAIQFTNAQDNTNYCNAVQNDVGLIRYPLGTIAVTSTNEGEIADAMTLVPNIYPCIDSVVIKGKGEDWRASLSGDPSNLIVRYKENKPSGATTTSITVTPHVSVFKITFPEGTKRKYLVFDFTKYRVDEWAALYKWTERTVTRIDDKTIQATIGEPGKTGAYYIVKFSEPCLGSGTLDSLGICKNGANSITGTKLEMYAQFNSSKVTVAIAESFMSMDQAKTFLESEFSDFERAQQSCRTAWNQTLNHVQIEGTENSKRMVYSALYTLLVNVIDGSTGSCYLKYYERPYSLASSAYWQFIGGFQSCCWDNYRTSYPFLMLGYPDVMSDIVNTYLARYQRDGFVGGNICLFTGPTADHDGIRFTSVLTAQANATGIQADYSKFYLALKDNYHNDKYFPESISRVGYELQPQTGGCACSHSLEWATSSYAMAILANANKDSGETTRQLRLSYIYKNLWDSTNLVFRIKDENGNWGAMVKKTGLVSENWTWNPNPQGLFEGTSLDWMFSVPHDPYGLIDLPGEKQGFTERVTQYCLNDTWFNDYQYHYPYLLYYAGSANQAQRILRTSWIPLFRKGILFEGVSPNPSYTPVWKPFYTSNAGWLLCSMIGLYPVPSPVGQYIISSPAIQNAVIHHGDKEIVVRTRNNSDSNIYIRSIQVDGKPYPCYMIPAKRLVQGAKIDIEMSSDSSSSLGSLYISSTNGYVINAEMVSSSHLRCTIEPAVENATIKIYSDDKPVIVMVNGKKTKEWNYDMKSKIASIQIAARSEIEIFSK